jgi:manganese transport protein
VGIIGATVMPHALFVHSAKMQRRIVPRNTHEARRIIRFEHIDIVLALGLAGLVNMAMLACAAAVFYANGHSDVAGIESADETLRPLLGSAASTVFLVALLFSGLSSSVVGTMAGQTVMQGFVGFPIPIWLRRLVTMAPPIIVIALGIDATRALVISQVVLSLTLPFPLLALVMLTSRRGVMGELANTAWVKWLAGACAAAITLLNVMFLLSSGGLVLAS